ncbi:hypothetical protein [Zunongwangia sp. H14]|uniref:hypothetical protein n=1 Tax=Zunongwangia sp. H14 TaxID=3240792 RepID=UPI00356482EC
MKKITLFSGILACIFLFACSEPDVQATNISGESGITYKNSKSSWQGLKTAKGENYRYRIEFTSWTGYSQETEITVIKGEIEKREFHAFQQNFTDEQLVYEELESYVETGEELGTHEKGAALRTIDELYETCISELLVVNQSSNTLYFDTDENGIISECGYVPKGCVDDCFAGFKLKKFNWITSL